MLSACRSSPRAARRCTARRSESSCWRRRFPRIPGDMGNATTWPFPVLYRVVRGATPERVVLNAAAGLLDDFLAAAAELVARRRRGDHHQLRLPVAVPGGTGGACAGPGRHQRADPGAVGAGDAAAGPARRRHHGVRRFADAAASGSGRRAARHAVRRHRGRPRVLPRADPRREAGHGRGAGRRRHPGRRTDAGVAPSRYRRDRAGMHQHAALRVRAARGAGPAGLRHLLADHLAARRAAPA